MITPFLPGFVGIRAAIIIYYKYIGLSNHYSFIKVFMKNQTKLSHSKNQKSENLIICLFYFFILDQEEKMATFIQQFKALMYKHILYKKRNKGQLIQVHYKSMLIYDVHCIL